MKVIGIVGSRRRNTPDDLTKVTGAFLQEYVSGDEIVSGGCPQGGDRFAETIARQKQVPIKIYYAEWDRLGKSAGFQRNTYIAQDSAVLIACVAPDRKGGTEDTIQKFQRLHPEGRVILV